MSAERIDFAAEGLLEGLEGQARAERLTLLEELTADGIPLSELRRTTASGTILFLSADRTDPPPGNPKHQFPFSAYLQCREQRRDVRSGR